MNTILITVSVFAIVTALVAALVKDRVVAVLAAGATGLFASIIFIILGAPDVAMTEAAIGSGLTTFIFFFALIRIIHNNHTSDKLNPKLKHPNLIQTTSFHFLFLFFFPITKNTIDKIADMYIGYKINIDSIPIDYLCFFGL